MGRTSHSQAKSWVTSTSRKIAWTYDSCKEEIGQGSFGIVRTAVARSVTGDSFVGVWDPYVGEEVVVKHISKAKVAAFRDAVHNEVNIFKIVTGHPGFPKLYDVFEDKENVLLVMEYCRGGELTDAISKLSQCSESALAAVFNQIMRAVAYMHSQNIIHRDLKPENFLLKDPLCMAKGSKEPDFTKVRICCADFGLAAQMADEAEKLEDASGTLDFMAPEQLGGMPYLGKPADVWSCGCILYLLLSGRPPFQGANRQALQTRIRGAMLEFPQDAWCNVSSSAKDLIQKMMSLDWQHRITAEDVLEHPWFHECTQRIESDEPVLDSVVVSHLQQFNKWSAIKKGLTHQLAKYLAHSHDGENVGGGEAEDQAGNFASSLLSSRRNLLESGALQRRQSRKSASSAGDLPQQGLEANMNRLRKIFDSLDTENTGTITVSQLAHGMEQIGFRMKESEVQELLESLDVNHNHVLDYEEFLAGTLRLQIAEHNDMLEQIFRKFDLNGDGFISIDELRQVLHVESAEDEEALNAFINHIDIDEDGGIDYMEFLHVFSAES
eukprot:CAMPEP_0114243382 /NCGR_PEP_ID=MMETSP0058-20121206/10755_1 /TAXON_ID=36894 /ORGANISM="Pyramimonas parkeae, CCMP726" /LENGTH=551 /DNA_ID=CAMNT_0001356209 /DNA_START=166 /DNA_END=1821 /DNA_ORIENTATION=+